MVHAKGGGYTDAAFTPGVAVTAAMSYVDASLAKIVAELKAKNLYASTLIVLTAKHGQSPGDPSLLVKNGDTLTALMVANGYLDADGDIRPGRHNVGQSQRRLGPVWHRDDPDRRRRPDLVARPEPGGRCTIEDSKFVGQVLLKPTDGGPICTNLIVGWYQ